MNFADLHDVKAALKEQLGDGELTPLEDLKGSEAENRILIQVLAERLIQAEGELAGVSEKFRIVREAEAAWVLVLRARDKAVFVNQAGETAILPAQLVSVLAAGRAADVQVLIGKGTVTLDDERGSRSSVPLSFFIHLGRVLKQWDSALGASLTPTIPKTEVIS